MDSFFKKLHWKYTSLLCTGRWRVMIAMVAVGRYQSTPMGEDSSGGEDFP